MLDVPTFAPDEVDAAARVFHRDGFVVVRDAFTPDQLAFAQAGARRVVGEFLQRVPLTEGNRGHARYSFGQQVHHPEWSLLIELPTILPIIDRIWDGGDYSCTGAGGDFSVPGATIQHLHSDIRDMFRDPLGQVTVQDVPTPFIVVNFLMTEFTARNGAIRFVPGTQRSRSTPPPLEEEPAWMQGNILCAPAGTAIIRDVRCWHGGTANQADAPRVMTSVGYYAPWLANPHAAVLPRARYDELSQRGQHLCRYIVETELQPWQAPKDAGRMG